MKTCDTPPPPPLILLPLQLHLFYTDTPNSHSAYLCIINSSNPNQPSHLQSNTLESTILLTHSLTHYLSVQSKIHTPTSKKITMFLSQNQTARIICLGRRSSRVPDAAYIAVWFLKECRVEGEVGWEGEMDGYGVLEGGWCFWKE